MLSVQEAAAYLGVSRWTVQRLVKANNFRAISIAGRIVYDPHDLDAYIQRQREVPMARKAAVYTVSDLVTDLLNYYDMQGEHKQAKKTRKAWSNHLCHAFAALPAKDLSTDLMRDYRVKRRAAGVIHTTINRELQVLRRAFKIAARHSPPKVAASPFFEMASEDNARQSFITKDELEKLRTAANHHSLWARTLVEMAYIFGWRRGEMLALHVRDVNIEEGTVRLETSKNGEAREVPMTEALRTLVAQLVADKQPDDRLFVSEPTVKKMWNQIRKETGVDRYFHDFRRTSARSKRAAGIPEGTIMAIQGWKTAAMFRRYAIVDIEDKRRALSKLA